MVEFAVRFLDPVDAFVHFDAEMVHEPWAEGLVDGLVVKQQVLQTQGQNL